MALAEARARHHKATVGVIKDDVKQLAEDMFGRSEGTMFRMLCGSHILHKTRDEW